MGDTGGTCTSTTGYRVGQEHGTDFGDRQCVYIGIPIHPVIVGCTCPDNSIAELVVRSTPYYCTCIGSTIVQCCPDYYYSYLYTTTLCQYCTSTTVRTSVRRTCTRLVYVRQSYSCSTCSVRTGTPDYHWIYRNSYLYTLSVPKSVPCSYPTRYTVIAAVGGVCTYY